MLKAWKRVLEITFTSQLLKKKLIFGNDDNNQLNISVSGNKYLSSMKDEVTITISNLRYSEICQLISGQYYTVEIKCGYRKGNIFTIFKGGVIFIQNEVSDRRSNNVVISCGNELIARYSQRKMNLSLASNINMYAALNYICEKAQIKTSNISKDLAKQVIEDTISSSNKSVASFLDIFTTTNGLTMNADSSGNSILSIWNSEEQQLRQFDVNDKMVNIIDNYPTLTSDGLTVKILPTFGFMPGDVIKIDNTLINFSGDRYKANVGNYADQDGKYMIYKVSFQLDNRSNDYYMTLKCKAYSLYRKFRSAAFGD